MLDLSKIHLRTSPIILVMRIIGLSTISNTIILITAISSEYIENFHESKLLNLVAYDTAISIVLLILQFFIAMYMLLAWFREHYIVTKDYLIHKRGLILSNEKRFKLANIESISYKQTLFGKLLEYADIKIKYPDNDKEIVLKAISYPDQFIHMMEESR